MFGLVLSSFIFGATNVIKLVFVNFQRLNDPEGVCVGGGGWGVGVGVGVVGVTHI